MKVTLLYPAVGKKPGMKYISSWKMEPLPLMTLAALTPPDVEVVFFDDRIEQIDYDHSTDLVAINIEAYSALRAYGIAAEFRRRHIPVVFGGYHATLMPDEAAQHGDAVVIGEAEGLWPQVIADCRRGSLRKFYRAANRPLFGSVLPRRDILRGKAYTALTLVETSRGCVHNCNFCSIKTYYERTYRFRTPESIVAEIEAIGSKAVFFVDDNISADRKRALALFQALRPLGITWVSQFSINMAQDEEILRAMRASGCAGVLIGFESLERKNLEQMGKAWNLKVQYEQPLAKLRDHGICVYATFVFGYDYDDQAVVDKTVEFAVRHKLFLAAFNHLLPFPGTDLYRQLEKEGRLVFKNWWLDAAYCYGKIPYRPRLMTPEALEQACIKARNDFYSVPCILRRSLDRKANCARASLAAVFFAQNFLARREVKEKWGLPLGIHLDTPNK
ncbi:MAG: radical SAM protein [Pseudomonadota bacterium]